MVSFWKGPLVWGVSWVVCDSALQTVARFVKPGNNFLAPKGGAVLSEGWVLFRVRLPPLPSPVAAAISNVPIEIYGLSIFRL